MSGVLTEPGATQLVRMLSFAHSQARLLVSWFSAAGEVQARVKLLEISKSSKSNQVRTFSCSVDGYVVNADDASERGDVDDGACS